VHPTAADRFDDALGALDPAAPELLPARIARACVDALPVDGAGLSLHAGALRVPIGASGAVAAHAERLQFTFGDGPCLRAHDDGRGIAFAPRDIERNWPGLFAALLADSPYRGVLSVPPPNRSARPWCSTSGCTRPMPCPGSTAGTWTPSWTG
jgi:hypothetical protein